jgi:hypothetical protein
VAPGLRDGAAASVDTPIDLLDLKPVYAQAAGGLRVALVWIVGVSIAGLFFLEQDARVILPILVTVSIGAAVGGAALLLQSRKLSAQIRTAKHSELEKLEAEIRRLRDAMLAGGPDPPGRLADLLGYETRIRNVSELPFEMATVRRLGLYLLIPLASMTGGALMERLVGLLLD